jgi:4-amino-4-deoxy-L-arabinose transferase-like glycosyltransferase
LKSGRRIASALTGWGFLFSAGDAAMTGGREIQFDDWRNQTHAPNFQTLRKNKLHPKSSDNSRPGFARSSRAALPRDKYSKLLIPACALVVAGLTLMRGIFAAVHPLRVDEAYYWTWSRESVISYLDHPPMIAWCIHLGTAIFGDTNFGVRFSGLLAMLVMQVLLADIVWRTTRDWRYAILAVLLPEVALDYGLLMTKVAPDTALIAFALATVWALVRMALSGNQRWWLLAGVFGGFALLSKYTVILLLPAMVAFAVFPSWRKTQLSSPYPWLAALIAVVIFSPVIYWNAVHDWVSFKFQLDRPVQTQGWSLKFLGEFVGNQFLLLGPILFPMILVGTTMLGWRGFRIKDPIAILLSMCVAVPVGFFLWRSLYARIGDSWPLSIWPFGFACVAINMKLWRQEAPGSSMARMAPSFAVAAVLTGIGFVVLAMIYYTGANANYLGKNDPIGKEAGFAQVVEAANGALKKAGATWFATTDYRIYSMLRWHLRDRIPVVQINERSRYIGFGTRDADIAGPAGLYVAPKDQTMSEDWGSTTALLEPVGQADLTWRGVRYDTYLMQKLTNWRPVLSPPPGAPLYKSVPH